MSTSQPSISYFSILRRAVLALLFAFLLFSPSKASAQTDATISGRITNRSGDALPSSRVYFYRFDSYYEQWDLLNTYPLFTDENGYYTWTLQPGIYRFEFSPPYPSYSDPQLYRSIFYSNQNSFETATDVTVVAGENLTGYDVTLPDAGRVVGQVVDREGNGIEGIEVQLIANDWPEFTVISQTDTDGDGRFVHYIGRSIEHFLFFNDRQEIYHLDEYYDNKPTLQASDAISVAQNEILTITVQLRRTGTINGTVTDNQGNPLSGIYVTAHGSGNVSPQITDINGAYIITSLVGSQYQLSFGSNYTVNEYYPNQSSADNAQVLEFTEEVDSITANAMLTLYGRISGRVTDVYGKPIEGVAVDRWYWYGDEWVITDNYVYTDENGQYWAIANPTRKYRLEFKSNYVPDRGDYAAEYYPNARLIRDGQTITVPVETTIPNIDVVMRLDTEVEADFVGTQRSNSLAVDFTDHSLGGILSQEWDFGDGTTSDEINPAHTYPLSDVYTVTLTVTGSVNSHVMTKAIGVSVADTPITNLQIEQSNPETQPKIGQALYFSATSVGNNVQYVWDFGDNTLSSATTAMGRYVQHSYSTAGTYTVTLTAYNGIDEEMVIMPITIQGEEAPVSALILHGPNRVGVHASIILSATVAVGDNVTYTWDFGDGESGTGQTVSHSYAEAGTYTITLTASNSRGDEQVTSQMVVKHDLLLPKLNR